MLVTDQFESGAYESEQGAHQAVSDDPAQTPENATPNFLNNRIATHWQTKRYGPAHADAVQAAHQAKEESGVKDGHWMIVIYFSI